MHPRAEYPIARLMFLDWRWCIFCIETTALKSPIPFSGQGVIFYVLLIWGWYLSVTHLFTYMKYSTHLWIIYGNDSLNKMMAFFILSSRFIWPSCGHIHVVTVFHIVWLVSADWTSGSTERVKPFGAIQAALWYEYTCTPKCLNPHDTEKGKKCHLYHNGVEVRWMDLGVTIQ